MGSVLAVDIGNTNLTFGLFRGERVVRRSRLATAPLPSVAALRAAEVKAARAVRLEHQGKNGEALALWREVMGKYFPTG